ncbi:MAG: hypothetical protein D6B26_01780, partial [Spirochaetaceae bacterium]
IQTLGFGNYSFGDIMRLWGAAVLLSNETTLVADTIGYGYNSGSAFVSGDYSLGSINLYNYQFYDGQSTLTGPYIYDLADIPETITRATNILAYAGQFTGLQSWDIDMPPGMLMTVIVR